MKPSDHFGRPLPDHKGTDYVSLQGGKFDGVELWFTTEVPKTIKLDDEIYVVTYQELSSDFQAKLMPKL